MGQQTKPQITQKSTKTQRRSSAFLCISVAVLWFCGVAADPAEANVVSGLAKIVGGVLNIPLSILVGTVSGPPLVGTLMGAVSGTINGLGMIAGGALELAVDGAALAKAAAPYGLPFVF